MPLPDPCSGKWFGINILKASYRLPKQETHNSVQIIDSKSTKYKRLAIFTLKQWMDKLSIHCSVTHDGA